MKKSIEISPNIEALPADRGPGRGQKRLRHVGHVDEVAALRTVADNGVRLAREFLPEEHAEDRTIHAGRPHTRPIGIEDADRVDRKPIYPVPVKGRLFL